jgi:hypothetical protein
MISWEGIARRAWGRRMSHTLPLGIFELCSRPNFPQSGFCVRFAPIGQQQLFWGRSEWGAGRGQGIQKRCSHRLKAVRYIVQAMTRLRLVVVALALTCVWYIFTYSHNSILQQKKTSEGKTSAGRPTKGKTRRVTDCASLGHRQLLETEREREREGERDVPGRSLVQLHVGR